MHSDCLVNICSAFDLRINDKQMLSEAGRMKELTKHKTVEREHGTWMPLKSNKKYSDD